MSTQSARRRARRPRENATWRDAREDERDAGSPGAQVELAARSGAADTGVERGVEADTGAGVGAENQSGEWGAYRDHRALADRSQYTFDEQSFAFDVEVKKTPADVARARQAEFIA